jgi:uncharacterized protein YkwD
MLAALACAVFATFARADTPTDAARAEAFLTAAINAARAERMPEAPPLQTDAMLTAIARTRAEAMAHGAPFAHEDHEGRRPAIDMIQARFGPYGAIGENIAMETSTGRSFDAAGFARRMAANWLASPDHRDNILSAKYDRAGIGVAIAGDHAFAVQLFHGPVRAERRPRPARIPRMYGWPNR